MKKILSAVLAASLALAAALPAFAAAKDSKQMEKVVGAVKGAVEVPAQFSEFDCSSYQTGDKETRWNLRWYSPDGTEDKKQGNVYVVADDTGAVLNYHLNYYSLEHKPLTSLEREEGKKIADAFLQKLSPSLAAAVELKDVRVGNYSYRYVYQQMAGGIPVKGRQLTVSVDKSLEKVVDYQGFVYREMKFPAAEGVLSRQDAAKAYLDKVGIKLEYSSYYDYKNKRTIVFPIYRTVPEEGTAIDALTGETVKLPNLDQYGEVLDDDAMELAAEKNIATGGGGDGGYTMTKEEQAKADSLAGQITAAQAAQKLRAAFPLLTADYVVESSRRNADSEGKYTWSVSFSTKADSKAEVYGAQGMVDAKTGEILRFYIDPKVTGKVLTPEQAKEQADKLIKALAPDKAKNVKFSQREYAALLEARKLYPDANHNYSFRYTRYVNGIEFPEDSISVTYDSTKGQFTRYSLNWTDKATFPALDKVKSKSEIFELMDKDMSFGLQYVVQKGDKAQLVYDFLDTSARRYNPFTGKAVDYENNPLRATDEVPTYTDIKGNWAESRIEKLTDNGYYIYSGSEFNPNTVITQQNYLRFLTMVFFGDADARSYSDDEVYNAMTGYGVITKDEIKRGSPVTRQEAAKFAVRVLGYDKAAGKSEIFAKPYTDVSDSAYLGYLALAKGFDLLVDNADGTIKPDQNLTNAYAAYMVYQLLMAKN